MLRNGRFQGWTRDLYPAATPRLRFAVLGALLFAALLLSTIGLTHGLFVLRQRVQVSRIDTTVANIRPTAFARTAIAVAPRIGAVSTGTAPTVASQPPFGIMLNTTSLRTEADTNRDNIAGLLLLGDEVEMVGEDDPSAPIWYRVRVRTTGGRLAEGTEGWVLASLVMVRMPDAPIDAVGRVPSMSDR